MARKIINKNLDNARILKDYASWIYCDQCSNTIAYLCYSNYNHFTLDFMCLCGNNGKIELTLETKTPHFVLAEKQLPVVKNRYVCPIDEVPLFSFVTKNLKYASCSIGCECCSNQYNAEIDNR